MNLITQLSPQKLHLESYPLKLMHVYVMYMIYMLSVKSTPTTCRGRHSRDRMEVRFTAIYAISAFHHQCCEFESRSWRGVLDTILRIKFSVSCDRSVVFSTNKTDRHDITEILLKVVLNTNPNLIMNIKLVQCIIILKCFSLRSAQPLLFDQSLV